MPNYHIYHYRATGRPYKLMTILLTFCLAITLFMLIYTNRGRSESGILVHKARVSVPFKHTLSENIKGRSLHGETINDIDYTDIGLEVEPFRPLPETLLHALYEQKGPHAATAKLENSRKQYFSLGSLYEMSVASAKKPTNNVTTIIRFAGNKTAKTTTKKTMKEIDTNNWNVEVKKSSLQRKSDEGSNKTEWQIKRMLQKKNPTIVESYSYRATAKRNFSFEHTNLKRLKHVFSACAKFGNYWKNSKPQAEFYHSIDHNLLYCKVAKGGCTFWEQLFSFILRPDSMKHDNYSTMYEIPRWRIHFDKMITPPSHLWSNELKAILGKNITRFMFTRDPFSRIWSAYVDKIWLPDFWSWLKIGKHRTLDIHDRCLFDVSFADFVEYISNKNNSNKHWAPVHTSCNPCVFQPHIMGNMSTFVADAKHILKTSGLDFYLFQYDHRKRVGLELKMLVEYNFQRFKHNKKIYEYCKFTEQELAYRLWKTFQINGYISKNHDFPHGLRSFDETIVLSSILSNIEKNSLSQEESSSQRTLYLHQAYRSVPRNIIEGMVKRFEPDFHLFAFDKNPSFLLKDGESPVPFDW